MVQFKTARIRNEFEDFRTQNQPLRRLVLDLSDFVMLEFGKAVVLTCIYRSLADQESIYGKGTKRTSPHMRWQAVDIRDRIYTDSEKGAIVQFLKQYDTMNWLQMIPPAGSRTVWLHQVPGQAMHFHIQYRGPMFFIFSDAMVITAGQ